MPRRSFEGLLLSEVPTSPDLLGALATAGFDPDFPDHAYPYEVWQRALKACSHLLFADRPEAEAMFALGGRFATGFRRTIVGRVLLSHPASLRAPERALARLPAVLQAGVKGFELELDPVRARTWRLRALALGEEAHFFAGAVSGLLEELHLPALEVRVTARRGRGFELSIGWEAGGYDA